MPVLNHVHTYKRVKGQKYICSDPYCTHIQEKYFLEGKAAVCNGCGEEFILDRHALRVAKPKCMKCRDTQEAKLARVVVDRIKELFPPEPIEVVEKTEDERIQELEL